MAAETTKEKREAKRREQIARRCVHYLAPMHNEKCASGHCYRDLMRPLTEEERERMKAAGGTSRNWGMFVRIPCFSDNADPLECPSRYFPTPEEVEAESARQEASMQKFLTIMQTARPAIVAHIKETGRHGKDAAGVIPCPCCDGGSLHYRYAGAYNGHIHANCTTEGCAQWME